MKKSTKWKPTKPSDIYKFTVKQAKSHKNKEYCKVNGILMERELDHNREEHIKHLLDAECYSEVFTAQSPEELHEIADRELKFVTSKPMTKKKRKLFLSWRRWAKEMRCNYNSSQFYRNHGDSQWLMYRNRDATDDLVAKGQNNVGLVEKINDTQKKMMFLCFGLPGTIDMWSIERMCDIWQGTETVGPITLKLKDFLAPRKKMVYSQWSEWCKSNPVSESKTKYVHVGKFYEENKRNVTVLGVRDLRQLNKVIRESVEEDRKQSKHLAQIDKNWKSVGDEDQNWYEKMYPTHT